LTHRGAPGDFGRIDVCGGSSLNSALAPIMAGRPVAVQTMNTQLLKMMPIAALAFIAGCNTTPLNVSKSDEAVNTALTRAKFDMNCPSATGSVLTSEVMQGPTTFGPMVQTVQRAQFTVGVTGCGQRATYVVICAEGGNGCVAGAGQ